jgi:hypothetical protein
MATMDSIRSELADKGKNALAGLDTGLLGKVAEYTLRFHKIQKDINELKRDVDSLQPLPSSPTGQIA